jgi:hypothetical protein
VDILSSIAIALGGRLGAAFAEHGGSMGASMASINDGLVTAFYHLIDRTNTKESIFMVEYLHKLEWELFTDLNEGPNLRNAVPVSAIAGVLAQKCTCTYQQ